MCGIVGIMSWDGRPVRMEEIHSMSAAIVHRGPDEDGFYLGAHAGIGMRRLSIIDLKTGSQPISNEDGTVWVVFNGEIYNYRQLRAELDKRGHRFSTTTDTETIVHLYEEYGERCVEQMRGMFAFAVWDERKQTLLLARDRLGIKPLYYGEIGGRLLFASELKAILQIPEVERRLNWPAVSHLFTFLVTPASQSILEGIHKLEPGHTLLASSGKRISLRQYWDVHFAPDPKRTEEDTVAQLRQLFDETVRLHMVSDVPVGAFLSGGIDSSAVVASMTRAASGPLNTFSIGFTEGDYNELRFARIVAQSLGTQHYELVLEPNALDILEDLVRYLDEPLGDSSAIPTYMVSKLAAEHGKVVLSGDGGDELFAGYDKYAVERIERRADLVPEQIRSLLGKGAELLPDGVRGRNFLRHFALSGAARAADATTLFRRSEQRKLFQEEMFRQIREYDSCDLTIQYLAGAGGHWLSNLQYQDVKSYLPLDILPKVDRMSMAHSLEVRVPLLDHKLVEFAATIPPEWKLRGKTRKYIFKRALRGRLPDEIIDRQKHGFAVPLGHWFRGRLGEFVRDLLLSPTTRQRGIFQPAYIENLLHLHQKGRELDLQLWTLICFEMWCRTFLDRKTNRTGESEFEAAAPAVNAAGKRYGEHSKRANAL